MVEVVNNGNTRTFYKLENHGVKKIDIFPLLLLWSEYPNNSLNLTYIRFTNLIKDRL